MYRVVALIAAVACSHPAETPRPGPPDPDDTPDVENVVPNRFRYAWERRRAEYRPRTQGPWYTSPCNPNRIPTQSDAGFHYPKGPDDMAALVVHVRRSEDGTVLFLDRGRDNGVDETWSGVLLDDRGYALHEWVCVRSSVGGGSQLVIPLPFLDVQHYKHVALFQDPPRWNRSNRR